MYSIHLFDDRKQKLWAYFGLRSNTCAYRTRSLIWSRINSRTSHQIVAGVAVSREAITEEEETEEGVG